MKANELMVGDWISYIEDGKPYFARVSEVYKSSVFTEDGYFEGREVEENEIIPVPITPRILEKNDIHETHTNQWVWERKPHTNTDIMYQADVICFDKEFPRMENGGLHIGGFVHVASEHGMVYGECEYVHELQHALKLCRIEKEIKL